MVSIFQGVTGMKLEFIAVEAVGSIMQPVQINLVRSSKSNIFCYSNYAGRWEAHWHKSRTVVYGSKVINCEFRGIEHC